MFSRFASASRRAARQLSTAAAGDGSGFLIAGGVGVAAIACMVPRADESTHAATPPVADDASKKLMAVLSHGEELAKIAKVKREEPDLRKNHLNFSAVIVQAVRKPCPRGGVWVPPFPKTIQSWQLALCA